ncbi:MAG: hypothetical protein ACIAXF_15815 [Phycisphaerales bacterium JB063]
MPARVIATCFALACFAATAVVGLYNNNPALSIILSSFVVMIAAYIVGTILGAIAQHAVDEHIKQHKYNSPIPGEGLADDPDNDPIAGAATAPPA